MCGPIKGEVCFGCWHVELDDAWLVFEKQEPLLKLLGFQGGRICRGGAAKEALMSLPLLWLAGIQGRPGVRLAWQPVGSSSLPSEPSAPPFPVGGCGMREEAPPPHSNP